MADLPPEAVRTVTDPIRKAEQLALQHTAEGYKEAIRLLESVAFASDVQDLIAEYRTQLASLREKRLHQQQFTEETNKKDTALGIVLIVLIVLFLLAAVAGVIVLFVMWSKGKLPPKTVMLIVGGFAVIALLLIISKVKRG